MLRLCRLILLAEQKQQEQHSCTDTPVPANRRTQTARCRAGNVKFRLRVAPSTEQSGSAKACNAFSGIVSVVICALLVARRHGGRPNNARHPEHALARLRGEENSCQILRSAVVCPRTTLCEAQAAVHQLSTKASVQGHYCTAIQL